MCVCVLQKLWRCVCAVSGWWQRRRWKRRVLEPNWTAVGCFHEWIGCRPPKTPSVNIKLPKPWSTERKNSTHKEMPTSEKVVFYCVPGLHLAGIVLLVFPVVVRLSSCHFLFVPFSQFCLFGFFFFFSQNVFSQIHDGRKSSGVWSFFSYSLTLFRYVVSFYIESGTVLFLKEDVMSH